MGRRSHFLDSDQLYHLDQDPLEANNLARNTDHSEQLDKLKKTLTKELESQGRPFGEFIPGPDAVPVEKIQPYLQKLTQLKVIKRGFEVIDDKPKAATAPTSEPSRQEKRKLRDERKKKREKK